MRERMVVAVLAAVVLLALILTASSVGASPPRQESDVPGEVITAALVVGGINYQGRLTDSGGNPLNGTYDLTFQLWNAEAGGSQVGTNITVSNVAVDNGLFNVKIPVDHSDFNGQALWVRVRVRPSGGTWDDWMTPRQEILPVPYALSLRPGAVISGTVPLAGDYGGAALALLNDSGRGIYADVSGGGNAGRFIQRSVSSAVYGESVDGKGIYAVSTNDYGGYFTGYGGLRVETTDTEPGYGIYVTTDDSEAGNFNASNDDGIRAYGAGTGFYGVYGTSVNSYGVVANTNVSGGYGLYTGDKIYTGGGCVGCTSMLIAQNGSEATLQPGDVVAVTGIAEAPSERYSRPILGVRKVDASGQGMVGVVEGRYVRQLVNKETAHVETRYEEVPGPEGEHEPDLVPVDEVTVGTITVEDAHTTTEPVAPGEYLTVVYRGLAKVKAQGPISVGERLTISEGGLAASASSSLSISGAGLSGLAIGQALEPLGDGSDLIWVLIDIQ